MTSERRIRNNKLRRARQLRRRMLMMVATVALVITLSLSCFVIGSNAKDSSGPDSYKYYTSIEVKYGDTLWSIAERYYCNEYEDYNDYIKEVKLINSLYSDDISAGSSLVVPYYSSIYK